MYMQALKLENKSVFDGIEKENVMKYLFRQWIRSLFVSKYEMQEKVFWKNDYECHNGSSKVVYVGHVKIYTRTNVYTIRCKSQEGTKGYLGCGVNSRKSLAGEEHFRGSDLADGPFNETTWNRIKGDIIRYELVKIVKSVREE